MSVRPVPTSVVSTFTGALSPQMVLESLVSEMSAWVTVIQEEGTKRARIEAQRQVLLADIATKRDIILTYLERSFDERQANFTSLFGQLEAACAGGRSDEIALLLGAITTLASKSPFADLHDLDLLKGHLADDQYEWTV